MLIRLSWQQASGVGRTPNPPVIWGDIPKRNHSRCTAEHGTRVANPGTRRVPSGARRHAEGHVELENGGTAMLETIAIILIVLWLLGMVSGYTLGNFIYVLLVVAVVLFLVRLVSGQRV
jgi:hypothetical protein